MYIYIYGALWGPRVPIYGALWGPRGPGLMDPGLRVPGLMDPGPRDLSLPQYEKLQAYSQPYG